MILRRQPTPGSLTVACPGIRSQAAPLAPVAFVSRVFVFWHLLSLDAPTVAVLWTIFTARITHVPLPLTTPLAMALAVWMLYVADRLFDTRHLTGSAVPGTVYELERRHFFHHRYRVAFVVAIALATGLLAALAPRLPRAAVGLYVVEAACTAGYFLVIHAAPMSLRRAIPKEFLVGLFFAAATFIPTVSRVPALRPMLFPCAVLFSALCTLNCLYIYAWEHPESGHPHRMTRITIRLLLPATAGVLALSLALGLFWMGAHELAWYPTACAMSAAALMLLHGGRHRLSRLSLRTAADAALLTPILFLALLRS